MTTIRIFLILFYTPLLATDLDSSTTRIPAKAENARLGVLTLLFDKNEITSLPAVYEFCLPDGVVLANDLPVPIDINPKVSGHSVLEVNTGALPFLQLERFTKGERCFYIRVMRTTDEWIQILGGIDFLPPNPEGVLEFHLGISAAVSAAFNQFSPGNSADTEIFVDVRDLRRCCGAPIALTMTVRDAIDGELLPITANRRPVLALLDLGLPRVLLDQLALWPRASILELVSIVAGEKP